MSLEKQKLIDLEKTGLYVFHGSGENLDRLEPKQAYNFVNGISEKDGEPAIFASSVAEYAIFMAIINKKNCPKGSHASVGIFTTNKSVTFKYKASQLALDQIDEQSAGWVYIFNKSDFVENRRGGIEYVRHTSLVPVEKIKVMTRDLPKPIELYEEIKRQR